VQSYQIKESLELRCPPDLAAGYAELKDELTSGVDVNARLSRRLFDATFEDELLNDWGITHFHLGLRKADGTVTGTKIVLFAFVRDSIVHCIGFYDHCSWVKLEILEILQRNWPQAMEHARAYGVTGYDDLTEADRAKLRKAGGTVLTTVNGLVYASVGGGYTSAGTSMRAHWEADHAIQMVGDYEKRLHENIATVVEDFAAQGLQIGSEPAFAFGISGDGKAIAVEQSTGGYVILGEFPT
jgi:hypothetical protein